MLKMNELYNMDCMEGMAQFPDKYFELAIVDPPYGINVNMNMGKRKSERKKHIQKKWDCTPPNKAYFQELFRVSRNQIIWGANHFVKHLDKSSGWIVWDKLITGDVDFSACELAYTSFQCSLKKVDIRIQSNYLKETRIHPTQKPVALYEWLLQNYAKKGDKILDTHCGSASSLVACHNLGFEYIGFELDEDYFKLAKKRLDATKETQSIFNICEPQETEEQLTLEV